MGAIIGNRHFQDSGRNRADLALDEDSICGKLAGRYRPAFVSVRSRKIGPNHESISNLFLKKLLFISYIPIYRVIPG